jgi:hypothetical protein
MFAVTGPHRRVDATPALAVNFERLRPVAPHWPHRPRRGFGASPTVETVSAEDDATRGRTLAWMQNQTRDSTLTELDGARYLAWFARSDEAELSREVRHTRAMTMLWAFVASANQPPPEGRDAQDLRRARLEGGEHPEVAAGPRHARQPGGGHDGGLPRRLRRAPGGRQTPNVALARPVEKRPSWG